MGKKDYCFDIKNGRVDRYYSIQSEKDNVKKIYHQIEKSRNCILTVGKSKKVTINPKYEKELLTREETWGQKIISSIEKSSKEEVQEVIEMLDFDEFDKEDIYVEIKENEDGVDIVVYSSEPDIAEEGLQKYVDSQNHFEMIYGNSYFKYHRKYMLRPLLILNGEEKNWCNTYLYVFVNGMMLLKFEVPIADTDTSGFLHNDFQENFEKIVVRAYNDCKIVATDLGDICDWFVKSIFGNTARCVDSFDSIIITNYSPFIKNINHLSVKMKEKLFRILNAPVPEEENFDFSKKISEYFKQADDNISGQKTYLRTTGDCLTIIDKKFYEEYRERFCAINMHDEIENQILDIADETISQELCEEMCSTIEEKMYNEFLIDNINYNIEFSIIISMLKKMVNNQLYNNMIENSIKQIEQSRRKYYEALIMINEMTSCCYGSVSEQLSYFEKNMPHYFKREITEQKIESYNQILLQEQNCKNERFQNMVSYSTFIFTVIFGIPCISNSLRIVFDNIIWLNFVSDSANDVISILLWGILVIVLVIRRF